MKACREESSLVSAPPEFMKKTSEMQTITNNQTNLCLCKTMAKQPFPINLKGKTPEIQTSFIVF
jgi:hypothetical protein